MVSDKVAGRKAPRTKTGCWTCRERKVRCDEQRPICSNCVRLGLDCAGYGARITFRDDTPRVISRMEPVTDLEGCAVYDERRTSAYGQTSPTAYNSSGLQYKTYTPAYFEKHKDIEVETELLDNTAQIAFPAHIDTLSPTSAVGPANSAVPSLSSRRSSFNHEGHSGRPVWSSQNSPMLGPIRLPPFNQTNRGPPSPRYGFSGQHHNIYAAQQQYQIPSDHSYPPPAIVIENPDHMRSTAFDKANHSPSDWQAPHMAHSPSHLLIPGPRSRRTTMTSDASEARVREAPPQKWVEHYNRARPPASACSVEEPVHEEVIDLGVPSELRSLVNNIEPASQDPRDDETYLENYFSKLVPQLSYPDRGANNPFRMLLTALCPREIALIHAILAYSAADMSTNDKHVDAEKATFNSRKHYDASIELLHTQLEDVRHEQSTAALATVYFLNLTDVKNAIPQRHTGTLMRIIKARAIAGRIYEGGICWTWYNAKLGVLSALFGKPPAAMSYLIDNEQLPTPGQGNMYPFIKKTEEERIEHTIVSPIYALQLKLAVLQSKLSCLGSTDLSDRSVQYFEEISVLKIELESIWENRAKLVDDLIKDRVEEAFVRRWKTGVPAAQTAAVSYHTSRLYIELLVRGSFTHGQLMTSVQVIYRIFAKIHDAGEVFKRRFILVPVFLCSIISPEMIQRRQIFERMEDAVSTETTWKKALEVSIALMKEEQHNDAGPSKGFGTIKWHDICDKLNGITLF